MRSHLLEGRVRHRRLRPFTYELDHGVYSWALDLSELDEVDRRVRLFGRNRRAITTFRDDDHLPQPARDLPQAIDGLLREAGEDPTGWRITLVTNLRVLGYVFNPASFYLCRDATDTLRIVIVEVHNTHGERHLYLLRPDRAAETPNGAASAGAPKEAPFRAAMAKDFYVSPFIGMDGRYSVFVRDAGDRLSIAINEQADGQPLLTTNLVLRRRPLADRSLLWMLLRYPLVTQRTIGLIHWHALRLWLKGARFHRHGPATREAAARRASGRAAG